MSNSIVIMPLERNMNYFHTTIISAILLVAWVLRDVSPMDQKVAYLILLSPKFPLLTVGKKSQITSNLVLWRMIIERVIKTCNLFIH